MAAKRGYLLVIPIKRNDLKGDFMIEIKTKKNTAKVFTDDLDKVTRQQIAATARDPAYADAKIRIMPDTHAGRGCVIGMTMTLNGRVSPSLVGVDIGCGMEVVKLQKNEIDLPLLDSFIHQRIPAGKHSFDTPQACTTPLKDLFCYSVIDIERVLKSVGTLGGGNHFIEVDRDNTGHLYLIIHSGSRSLGAAIANHYRDMAFKYHLKKARKAHRADTRERREEEHSNYFSYDLAHFAADDSDTTRTTKASRRDDRDKLGVKWETAVCEGELYEQYLHDMNIAVRFAEENRRRIAEAICDGLHLTTIEHFSCVHNYIDEYRILRKGAISARQGERVLIPLNMKDGCLIATGLGNPDWNFSAPHGAGRACSRTDAKYAYNVETFQNLMAEAGIYTTSATKETLDECPMAYKSPDRILPYLGECVEIQEIIKPIYNFKAGKE